MNFGHSPRAFIEDGPTEQVAKAESMRSTARSWRVLDEARRIELVERALPHRPLTRAQQEERMIP